MGLIAMNDEYQEKKKYFIIEEKYPWHYAIKGLLKQRS
jgi:hypothetical protein